MNHGGHYDDDASWAVRRYGGKGAKEPAVVCGLKDSLMADLLVILGYVWLLDETITSLYYLEKDEKVRCTEAVPYTWYQKYHRFS